MNCRLCGSNHSPDVPCPSPEELAARTIAEAMARTCPGCRALTARLEAAEAERNEWRETVIELVAQCCSDSEGVLDSCAGSTQADALRMLAVAGYVEITTDVGRRVIGRWKPEAFKQAAALEEPR